MTPGAGWGAPGGLSYGPDNSTAVPTPVPLPHAWAADSHHGDGHTNYNKPWAPSRLPRQRSTLLPVRHVRCGTPIAVVRSRAEPKPCFVRLGTQQGTRGCREVLAGVFLHLRSWCGLGDSRLTGATSVALRIFVLSGFVRLGVASREDAIEVSIKEDHRDVEIKELELHTSLLPQQSLNHLSFKKPSLNQASLPKLKSLLALRAPASCLGSSFKPPYTRTSTRQWQEAVERRKAGIPPRPPRLPSGHGGAATARPGISAGRSRRIAQIAPSRGVNTAPGRESRDLCRVCPRYHLRALALVPT